MCYTVPTKQEKQRTGAALLDELKTIARIQSDFSTKFGVPRQSGVVPQLAATVVFQPPYRNADALRGLEDFSHIWLIWGFSHVKQVDWSPTVRPPRLGGNQRMGVFATRSPYRPNPIGLSAVRVAGLEQHPKLGPIIHVLGADLVDGTPIYDIKPYLPYADSIPNATGGFAAQAPGNALQVEIADEWLTLVPPEKRGALQSVLACDPRPSYQDDPARVYGMAFAGLEVRFTVAGNTLTVEEITLPRLPLNR